MPPPRSPLSRVVALIAAALLGGMLVTGVRPADVLGATSIADEAGAVRLAGTALDAAVADLDGDGTRELIRLVPYTRDTGQMAVEVLRPSRSGTWVSSGQAPLRRQLSVGEQLDPTGLRADAAGSVALLVNDAARLVTWRQGDRVRVLAVVNAGRPFQDEPPCCLTGWEVGSAPGSGATTIRQIVNTQRGGDAVLPVDMNDDGVDELAVHEPSAPPSVPSSFTLLQWRVDRFVAQTLNPMNAGDPTRMTVLHDSDGLPGDEIAFVGSFDGTQAQPAYGIVRVSLRAGKLHTERSDLPSLGVPLVVDPAPGTEEPRILFGDEDAPLAAFTWPPDAPRRTRANSLRHGRPVALLGTGPHARVVVSRAGPPATLDLIRPDLTDPAVESIAASAAARGFSGSVFPPYVGPWPELLDGRIQAFVFGGSLIQAPDGDDPRASPMASLPGMLLLGAVGEGGTRFALLQSLASPSARGSREGGALLRAEQYSVTIATTDQLLSSEADGGGLRPVTTGALADPADPSGRSVLIGVEGIRAVVAAPRGTVAEAYAGDERVIEVLGEDAGAGLAISEFPFRVPIRPSSTQNGNQTFDARLYLVTPAGHGYLASWHVRALRSPPPLHAESAFLSLSLDAEISGTTDPAATVTADGRSAAPDSKGAYRLGVPAGLVPRDVRIEATDPFGHVTVMTVSVVAPLDYRRLPWIPIVAVLTLGAAGVLFLRAPRLAQRPSQSSEDDGTFEEMDPRD